MAKPDILDRLSQQEEKQKKDLARLEARLKREDELRKTLKAKQQGLILIQKKQEREHKEIRGGLFVIAGLLRVNRVVLLGALLSEILPAVANNNQEKIAEWEAVGQRYYDKPYKGKERDAIKQTNETDVKKAILQNPLLADVNVR